MGVLERTMNIPAGNQIIGYWKCQEKKGVIVKVH